MGLGNDVVCMSLKIEFLLRLRLCSLFFLHEKNMRLHMINRINRTTVPAIIAAATTIAVGRSGPVGCVLVGTGEDRSVDEVIGPAGVLWRKKRDTRSMHAGSLSMIICRYSRFKVLLGQATSTCRLTQRMLMLTRKTTCVLSPWHVVIPTFPRIWHCV